MILAILYPCPSPHSGHIQSLSFLLLLPSPLSNRHVFAAIIDDFLPTFPASDSVTFRLDPAGAGKPRIGVDAGQTGFVSHRTRAQTRDWGSFEQRGRFRSGDFGFCSTLDDGWGGGR